MYETLRIVADIKPKYVIWENVKNILSKKHFHNFQSYLDEMERLGYDNYYQVLNAKDYGIPQNRERVFTISIRNDIGKGYEFPPKQELKLKLKDLLEDEVDEKYYLTDAMMNCFMSDGTGNYPRKERFLQNINRKNQNIGNAITSRAGSRPTDNFIKIKNKIRKLTPKECWRLMGFSDEVFEKAQKVNSNTQLYKQAGNSIVVNVLEKVLSKLL